MSLLGSKRIRPSGGEDLEVAEFQDRKLSHVDDDDEIAAEEGSSSLAEAIFNLSKTIIGAGIFSLPSALNEGGFFVSLFLIIFMGYVVDWTATTLVRTGLKVNILNYRRLVGHFMGKWGSAMYFVSAFVFAYGVCATYSIIVSDNLPLLIGAIFGVREGATSNELSMGMRIIMDRRVIIAIVSALVFFPVSSLRYLGGMATCSFIGLFMFLWAFFTVILVLWTDESSVPGGVGEVSGIYTIFKADGLIGTLNRSAFAYICHHNQLIIYRSIKNASLKKYKFVAHVSLLTSVLFGVLFSTLCYARLGARADEGNVILILSRDNIWVQLAGLAYSIDVILTYPLELFVCRELLVTAIHKRKSVGSWVRILYAGLLVLGTLLISLVICKVNDAVDITGGVAGSIVAFILPTLSAIFLMRRNGEFSYLKALPCMMTVAFGIVIIVLTFVQVVPKVKLDNGQCDYIYL